MNQASRSSGKQGATGTYADIRTTGANVTSYTDNDSALRDGTLYYYRVCATNAAGDSAFSNEASGTTPLAKPTSATATAVSSSQINLTWIDNSVSETGYKIERKRTAAGTYAQIDQVGANVQSYMIQMDLTLTQDIITESELPMGRLIPTTRTHRLL